MSDPQRDIQLEKLRILEEWLDEELEDLEWFGRPKTQADFEQGVYRGDREEDEIRIFIDLHQRLTEVKARLLGLGEG